jgi:hypothetical protein
MDNGSEDCRKTGRGERIRTSGLYVPNVALYQAKLHPDLPVRTREHREAPDDKQVAVF